MGLRSGDGLENVLFLDKTKEKRSTKKSSFTFLCLSYCVYDAINTVAFLRLRKKD